MRYRCVYPCRCGVTVSLHPQIRELLPREWYNVQRACPYIGQADFSSVRNMTDPDTGVPTVALVSPFYERGNVLDQANLNATKEQKRTWVSRPSSPRSPRPSDTNSGSSVPSVDSNMPGGGPPPQQRYYSRQYSSSESGPFDQPHGI